MPNADREPKEFYGSLRLYSTIAFAVGWLIIGLGLLATIVGVVMAVTDDDLLGLDRPILILASVGALVFVGLIGLGLLAIADLIYVFIDIEHNTRRTAARLLDVLEKPDETE